MAFTEDLSVFFRTEDFGVSAYYSRTARNVMGILDAEYDEPMGRVQASRPVFACRTEDVEEAAHGDTLKIGTTTYEIVGVEPDGTGVTILKLEKQ